MKYQCPIHVTDDVFMHDGYLACGVTRRVYFGGSGEGFDIPCANPVKEVNDGDAKEPAVRQPERDDERSSASPDGGGIRQ